MREESFLCGWPREDVEEEKAEMQRLSEEAEQEEARTGKREVEREGERIEIKRRCWKRVSGDVFEDYSDEYSLGVLVIVHAVSSSVTVVLVVPVVPVSPSDVNVVGEVVCSFGV